MKNFTAMYKKSGKWYLGWVREVPGANTQGRTLREAKENLKEALSLILEANEAMWLHELGKGRVISEPLAFAM